MNDAESRDPERTEGQARRGFATRAVHAGQEPDPVTGARAPPLYQTTSYAFEDADHAAALYALEAEGDVYSRISNPTVATLERRLADLESGSEAVATASGMSALDALTLVLAGVGENVVSAASIYGGTTAYLNHTAGARGIETRFVDTLDYEAYAEAIDANTAFVHLETIGNPSLVVPEIERVGKIAHDAGVPLVVDNTFGTPYLCRPLEHGADVVWESTTKWLHGSGTTVGGVVVDGGSFPWHEHPDSYPELAGPNRAYHDTDFARDFPEAPLAAAVRYRATRTVGHSQNPFDAWQTLQGLESFPLRMARHCENAGAVAEFLADHPEVAWVSYPGLTEHETHEEATRYLDGGYGGMVTFGLEGGYEAGRTFVESVDLASFLANVGDAKTLVIHPASTTHGQLSEEEQLAAGVTRDLVRLSAGIEAVEDVIADLDRAIERAVGR